MIAAATLLAAACTSPATPAAGDGTSARGGGPARIVSLNPCIDAILVEVADPAQIAAISHYSHNIRASSISADVARRHGSARPDADRIIPHAPDLVLADSFTPPPTIAALRRLGLRVEVVPMARTIAENRAQIMAIAVLVGRPAAGRALNARIDAALAETVLPAGAVPLPALIRQGGGMVPGAGTLADEMMAHVGLVNQASALGLAQWDVLPLEPLLAAPPRLLLTDRGGRSERAGLHPAIRALDGRMAVADYPMRLLNCGGPVIIPALERLAAARAAALPR